MKARWMTLSALAFLLPILAQAQSSYYEDDLYYNPEKSRVETSVNKKHANVEQSQDESVRVHDITGTLRRENLRSVDEYNRRYTNDSSILENEDSSALLDENGQPFEYSERVRRFYNPEFTTHITDDRYIDIYAEEGADIDVYYIDANTMRWMSPFYYDSYYYPRYGYSINNFYNNSRFGFYYDPWSYSSWGYYDPWYSGSFGYAYNPWYGNYYGYGYDYDYYGGGYYGGHHGHGNIGDGSHGRLTEDQRRFITSNGSGRSVNTRSQNGTARTNDVNTRSRNGSYTQSASGTNTRSTYNTSTRSGLGTSTRPDYGTSTRSGSSTRSSSTETTRTSNSGSSTSTTRSNTNTPSSSSSTRVISTPERSSSSSSSSTYTPSRSSSSSSSSSSGGSSSRSSSSGSGRR